MIVPNQENIKVHFAGAEQLNHTISILSGKVITEDVYPLICNSKESSIDIDYMIDFISAESFFEV